MSRVRFLMVSDSRGHTAGYYTVARALRDAGAEVILGGFLQPEEIAEVAGQEDVDFIGYRIMDREPLAVVGPLMESLESHGLGHVRVIAGGIISPRASKELQGMGVERIFRPGSRLEDIAAFVLGEPVSLPAEPGPASLGLPPRVGIYVLSQKLVGKSERSRRISSADGPGEGFGVRVAKLR